MTKMLRVGGVPIGGGAPVSIQSMCNTKTDDVDATVAQIHRADVMKFTKNRAVNDYRALLDELIQRGVL